MLNIFFDNCYALARYTVLNNNSVRMRRSSSQIAKVNALDSLNPRIHLIRCLLVKIINENFSYFAYQPIKYKFHVSGNFGLLLI